MTSHDLVKHGPGQYECLICGQTWSRKPAANKCPGVKVYPQNAPVPLITKGQLGYYGYRTSEKSLPPPAGCIPGPFGSYVLLYDPAQAVKKQRRSRPRKRITITEILWPVKLIPLIESFNLNDEDLIYLVHAYTSRTQEIANMIVHFATFTPDEITHLAGECVQLVIPPTLTHPAYPSFSVDAMEQHKLATGIAAAYKRYKVTV